MNASLNILEWSEIEIYISYDTDFFSGSDEAGMLSDGRVSRSFFSVNVGILKHLICISATRFLPPF